MILKNNAEQGGLFFKHIVGSFFFFCFICLICGCSTTKLSNFKSRHHYRYPDRFDSAPNFHINVNNIPNAVPKKEPKSKRGNPRSYVVFGKRYYVLKTAKNYHAKGIASWYGMKFHRFLTADGDVYKVTGMTAAHKTLPLPTYVEVTNLRNRKKIIVKVNDRGPFVDNRLIDLSYVAAKKLGMLKTGTAPVSIRAIIPGITRLAHTYHHQIISHIHHKQLAHSASHLHTQHYLYLGLFKQHKKAEKLALEIKKWTPAPVKIIKKLIHKHHYYKVLVGPLPSTKKIQRLHQRLQLAGLHPTYTL